MKFVSLREKGFQGRQKNASCMNVSRIPRRLGHTAYAWPISSSRLTQSGEIFHISVHRICNFPLFNKRAIYIHRTVRIANVGHPKRRILLGNIKKTIVAPQEVGYCFIIQQYLRVSGDGTWKRRESKGKAINHAEKSQGLRAHECQGQLPDFTLPEAEERHFSLLLSLFLARYLDERPLDYG